MNMAAPRPGLSASVPRPGWVDFKMKCPQDVRDRIMVEAAREGLTGAAYVRMVMMKHLAQLDRATAR